MTGIAGKGKSREHVEATSKLLNEIKPLGIGPMSTSVTPGSELENIRDAGEYVELTEGEILEEEIMMLESLDMEPSCFWYGMHVFNNVPVVGRFSDKDSMIQKLKNALKTMTEQEKNSIRQRGHI